MIEEILVSVSPGETRIACLEHGRAIELHRFLHGRSTGVGNVYLGRITRIASGIGAAFVDIGDARAGFLPLPTNTDEAKALHEGARIIVQVTREPERGKGAQLSAAVRIPGRFLVFAPGGEGINVARRIGAESESERLRAAIASFTKTNEGWIARTNAVGASVERLSREATVLRDLWQKVTASTGQEIPPRLIHHEPAPVVRILRDKAGSGLQRIVVDDGDAFAAARAFVAAYMPEAGDTLVRQAGSPSLFEQEGIEAEFEAIHNRRVPLPTGGSLIIEHTEALWAIDVNTGRHVSGHSPAATILATNLEAASEAARQVRLRDLAGLIVIDFVHMEQKTDRDRVLDQLASAMADDPSFPRLAGFSELGLVEVSRRRTRPAMIDELDMVCSTCEGRGMMAAPIVTALTALRAAAAEPGHAGAEPVRIHVPPQVVAAFDTPEGAAGKEELTARLGRPVEIIPDSTIAQDRFKLG